MGVRHRNRTKRTLNARSWKKGSKVFIQGSEGGNPYGKLRKITSNGLTCFCNKLGYQVVTESEQCEGWVVGLDWRGSLHRTNQSLLKKLLIHLISGYVIVSGKLNWVLLSYVPRAICIALIRALLTLDFSCLIVVLAKLSVLATRLWRYLFFSPLCPQHLAQYLKHSRCLINMSWMNYLTASKEWSTDWNPSLSDSKAQPFHHKKE